MLFHAWLLVIRLSRLVIIEFKIGTPSGFENSFVYEVAQW